MSRAAYDECDGDFDNWDYIRWRGRVTSSMRGKRGQQLFKDLIEALDAMPEKKLIAEKLQADEGVCALGCVGVKRGMDLSNIDPEDYEQVSKKFNIASPLAREVAWVNDECGPYKETPENRWQRIRAWAEHCLKKEKVEEEP